MIPNKQLLLLKSWQNNLFSQLTIFEIMKLSKKNSKPWVFNALKTLKKYNLIKSVRKGNIDLYNLNLNNPNLISIIQFVDSQSTLNFPKLNLIIEIINTIPIKAYCLIVFGSYAENKQKTDSDLDICFLIEDKDIEKRIKPYMNDIKLNTVIKIDDHYMSFEDFIAMLLRKEENLGKQIFKKHKIFYNADIYYRLIQEAHNHGFK